MPITDFDKYSKFTSDNPDLTADFKPLNFDELLNLGAFRVTHQGMDNGKYNPNPKAGFSLVSAYNDAVGENTQSWKDNPVAYNIVKNMFTKNPQDMGVHKYLQIVESAKDLGIPENKIYVQPNRKALIEQQINEISQE